MEDFFRVWIPLKRCLDLLDNAGNTDEQDVEHESGREQDVQTEDATACREALHTHLVWLSQCSEIIQEAVSEDIDSEEFIERLSKAFRRNRGNEK